MSNKILLLAFVLLALAQGKLVHHDQVKSGFACCPDTYIFEEKTLSCVCPANAAFVDANGRCVSCVSPSYWDVASKQCLTCPASTIYDAKVNKCVCPASSP